MLLGIIIIHYSQKPYRVGTIIIPVSLKKEGGAGKNWGLEVKQTPYHWEAGPLTPGCHPPHPSFYIFHSPSHPICINLPRSNQNKACRQQAAGCRYWADIWIMAGGGGALHTESLWYARHMIAMISLGEALRSASSIALVTGIYWLSTFLYFALRDTQTHGRW